MKLIAEQVKYLRERKEELLQKKNEFKRYLRENREKDTMDGSTLLYTDYHENQNYRRVLNEIESINEALQNCEIVTDRNFDMIDVGTSFYATFAGDDEKERITLVDTGIVANHNCGFVSLDSDFGKAVYGKKDGDLVTYTVNATGRKLSVSIDEIDRIKSNYTHFINEKTTNERMSRVAKEELRNLKEYNLEEYEARHMVSASQVELAREELAREENLSNTRKAFLYRMINAKAELPKDDTIGVGSRVSIVLKDENDEVEYKQFEFINRAISTELEDQYVERITSLGHAIYGLKKNDTFTVRRKNKPSLQGMVLDVVNDYEKQLKRVK